MLKYDLGAGGPASYLLVCGHDAVAGVELASGAPSVAKADSTSNFNRSKRTEQPPPDRQNPVSAEAVLRSFNTWAFKREQPSDPQLMLRIISGSIAAEAPVPFVLYWGKGPRCRLDQPDSECLDYLAGLGRRIRATYAPGAAMTLIFTDTHAELNGHSPQSIWEYFGAIDDAARRRGFETRRLSELVRTTSATLAPDRGQEPMPEELRRLLGAAASKWYHGHGTPEQGAAKYYQINLVEKRAVELAFPRVIFITFNGSALRRLFPAQLPIFFMYSLRRGVSVKPWFVPAASAPSMA